jgi:hypothetical protein
LGSGISLTGAGREARRGSGIPSSRLGGLLQEYERAA